MHHWRKYRRIYHWPYLEKYWSRSYINKIYLRKRLIFLEHYPISDDQVPKKWQQYARSQRVWFPFLSWFINLRLSHFGYDYRHICSGSYSHADINILRLRRECYVEVYMIGWVIKAITERNKMQWDKIWRKSKGSAKSEYYMWIYITSAKNFINSKITVHRVRFIKIM